MAGALVGERRAAAERLMVDYSRLVDNRDGAGWADLFGDTGVLAVGDREVTGKQALKDFAERSARGVHIQGLPSFEPGSDGLVHAVSSFLFVNVNSSGVISGWYHDELMPRDEGYRFRRRHIDIRTQG